MKKMLWVLLAVLALALSPPAATAQGKSKDKGKGKPAAAGKPETPGKSAEKGKAKGKPDQAMAAQHAEDEELGEEHEREAARGRAFGREHRRTIREFFGNQANLQGLPPGLAKREELPPGLQRHLERNGVLPPGLQKRLQPLPTSLSRRLPRTPAGVRRGVLNGNVVLVEERTSRVLDIMHDVLGGGRSEGRSTGVRRVE